MREVVYYWKVRAVQVLQRCLAHDLFTIVWNILYSNAESFLFAFKSMWTWVYIYFHFGTASISQLSIKDKIPVKTSHTRNTFTTFPHHIESFRSNSTWKIPLTFMPTLSWGKRGNSDRISWDGCWWCGIFGVPPLNCPLQMCTRCILPRQSRVVKTEGKSVSSVFIDAPYTQCIKQFPNINRIFGSCGRSIPSSTVSRYSYLKRQEVKKWKTTCWRIS